MKIKFLLSAILLMIASTTQAAEVVGKIGYMSGALVAQRTDGTIKVLGTKSDVQAGDMLITAHDSYAQVLMNDGAKMTLRPDSNLRIESFQFSKEEPKADNAVYQLLKGGFRNVTGLIGKRGNADAYKIRAASATIGIRGTDFSSRLCVSKDCKDEDEANVKREATPQVTQPQANINHTAPHPDGMPVDAEKLPGSESNAGEPGLYVTVHDGEVIVAQADKSLNLGRGETGFASSTALVRLPTPPAFMGADSKINLESGGSSGSSSGGCVIK